MAVNVGAPLAIITTAHANTNAVEYVFTDTTGKATITIEGQAGSVSSSGTDGAAQAADRQPLAADIPFELLLKGGSSRSPGAQSLFVAAAAAASVTVIAERAE